MQKPPPALKMIWDTNYVRFVGKKTLYVVDAQRLLASPDAHTSEELLPFEVAVLIDGERVVLENEEVTVRLDPFSVDPAEVARFYP